MSIVGETEHFCGVKRKVANIVHCGLAAANEPVWKKLSISIVGVKRKLRRLSSVGSSNISVVNAQAEDSQHRTFSLPVEFVGKVPNFDWLTQINLRLPDELSAGGDMWVKITVRGLASNEAKIRVTPVLIGLPVFLLIMILRLNHLGGHS